MTQISALVRRLPLFITIASLTFAVSCSSTKTKEDEGAVPNAPSADENLSGDSDSGQAMGLQTVNFAFDSFALTPEGKKIVKSNAEILKTNTNVNIQVEGHCDQSGGIQYNIALGEKRANATKKFLMDLGVSGDRISTISFGKERPLDTGAGDDAAAKNRRANFVITSK